MHTSTCLRHLVLLPLVCFPHGRQVVHGPDNWTRNTVPSPLAPPV